MGKLSKRREVGEFYFGRVEFEVFVGYLGRLVFIERFRAESFLGIINGGRLLELRLWVFGGRGRVRV